MEGSDFSRLSLLGVVLALGLMAMVLWLVKAGQEERSRGQDAGLHGQGVAAEPEPTLALHSRWRLEVDVHDENDRSVASRVYLTDRRGDLLMARETDAEGPLVQWVAGTVNVIAHVSRYVPQYVENLGPPPHGGLSLVVRLDRGAGISGRVLDDAGVPVTSDRVWGLVIHARPLDPPRWLWKAANWKGIVGRPFAFEATARGDSTFHVEGLPQGRYEILCDEPRSHDVHWGGAGALLRPEPVLAAVGDAEVCVTCPRAVEIHLRFVDLGTGEALPPDVALTWEASGDNGVRKYGYGALDEGRTLEVLPGTSFTLTAEVEGYERPDPIPIVANREVGAQDVVVRLQRVAGGFGELEVIVRDDLGAPVSPLMVGRAHSSRRYEPEDGRYILNLPAGLQRVELRSPDDQILLFKREWADDPGDFTPAHACLPRDIDVEIPREGRVVREVTIQRAALIWVRQEPEDAFPGVRLMQGDTEVEHAFMSLDEHKGLVAAVEPGRYTVEGHTGEEVVKVAVAAEVAEVAEVWLRAESTK